MSRSSLAKAALPLRAVQALRRLGADITVARKRRRMPQRLLAERMMVSEDTLQRLERGDPSVGLNVLAAALWALGLTDRLENVASPTADLVGVTAEAARLPRRARVAETDLDF